MENGIYKLTLKAGGSQSFKFVHASSQQEGLAFVIIMPSEFQFAMSDKQTGTWMDGFSGSFKNLITTPADTEFARFGTMARLPNTMHPFPMSSLLYRMARPPLNLRMT